MRARFIGSVSALGLSIATVTPVLAAGYNDDPSVDLKLIETVVVDLCGEPQLRQSVREFPRRQRPAECLQHRDSCSATATARR